MDMPKDAKPATITNGEWPMARIEAICLTSCGRIRTHNEDNYILGGQFRAVEWDDKPLQQYEKKIKKDKNIIGVFDGMGGMARGEHASRMAAEQFVMESPDDYEDVSDFLLRQCEKANRKIQEANAETGQESGTTAALVGFYRGRAVVCNVGDSRVYRKCGDKLERLSVDHTDGKLLEFLGVTERVPRLMQYLGQPILPLQPSISAVKLHRNDLFLCCTDGLHGMLTDAEISEELDVSLPLKEIAKDLMTASMDAGGGDNVTLILCRIHGFVW